jgi:DNA-binding transcriptional LysR family regulator
VNLEFRHLDVLVTIEEAGSLAAAARRLGTTRTYLARQLRRIENHLGHPVFHRGRDRLDPTAAGIEALALARRALRAVDGMHRTGTHGALRLLHHRIPVPAAVPALRAAHPGLDLVLDVSRREDAYRHLAGGHADAFAGIWLPHASWPARDDLVETVVLTELTTVHLPAAHRLAGTGEIRLADLAGEDWIVAADPDARRMTVGECRLVGGFDPVLRYQVEDAQQPALLAAGLGVAFGSAAADPGPGVVSRAYAGASSARWMLVHHARRVEPAVIASLSHLLARVHDGKPAPAGP